jgi:hypothetical protein
LIMLPRNAQSELSPLERGMHALGSQLGVREYARESGLAPSAITYQRQAAELFTRVNSSRDLLEKAKHLSEIHTAPRWLWQALVAAMLAAPGGGWSVEQTRAAGRDHVIRVTR